MHLDGTNEYWFDGHQVESMDIINDILHPVKPARD
jgi:hypothetical protein